MAKKKDGRCRLADNLSSCAGLYRKGLFVRLEERLNENCNSRMPISEAHLPERIYGMQRFLNCN